MGLRGKMRERSRRDWNQVREGTEHHTRASGLCLLDLGEPLKVSDQRRIKIMVCFKEDQ